MELFGITIIGFLLVSIVSSYPGGAPDDACFHFIPGHGAAPDTSASPYNITLPTEGCYTPGKDVRVKIAGGKFRGFLIKAIELKSHSSPIVASANGVGTFKKIPNNQVQLRCENAGITHKNNKDKENFNLIWTPPTPPVESVAFLFTIVQTQYVFWTTKVSGILPVCTDSPNIPNPNMPNPNPPTTKPTRKPRLNKAPKPTSNPRPNNPRPKTTRRPKKKNRPKNGKCVDSRTWEWNSRKCGTKCKCSGIKRTRGLMEECCKGRKCQKECCKSCKRFNS